MAQSIEKRTANVAKKLLKFFGPKGEHWTYGTSAADKDGQYTSVKSRKAVKWCLSGALEKLNVSGSIEDALDAKLGKLADKYGSLAGFNDSKHTYTHVRKFLERVAG